MNNAGLRIQSVEDFAKASARLATPFLARRDVLSELGLDDDGWENTRIRFRSLFEAEARSGSGNALAEKYRVAFEKERGRVADETTAPKVAVIEVQAPQVTPAAGPTALVAARANEVRPTYLRESRIGQAPAASPWSPPVPRTEPVIRSASPIATASPPAAVSSVAATMFVPEGAPAPRDPTPFQRPSAPTPETKPSDRPVPAALSTGTRIADPRSAAAAPLPFKEKTPAAEPRPASSPTSKPVSSGTAFVPEPIVSPALPFKGATPAGAGGQNVAEWTAEHYGELCADLEARGAHRPSVLSRAGLTAESFESLKQYWKARLSIDLQLAVRFTDAKKRRAESQKDT